MRRIITLTTDGGDREDASVFYAENILVDSNNNPALSFSEPIFASAQPAGTPHDGDYADAIGAIRALGYTVEELEQTIVICDGEND